jgi:hypothetical protein
MALSSTTDATSARTAVRSTCSLFIQMRGAIRADRLLRALVERDLHQLQMRAHEPIGRQRKALIAVATALVERRYLSGKAIGERSSRPTRW